MIDLFMLIVLAYTIIDLLKDFIEKNKPPQNGIRMRRGVYEKIHSEPPAYDYKNVCIRNKQLFEQDKSMYGEPKAYVWARDGKYKLTQEEADEEQKRIDEKFERLRDAIRRGEWLEDK